MTKADSTGAKALSSRQSLHGFVYDRIIERIFDGAYTAGDRLPTEEELAEQYGVSRVTVRHALQKLRDNRLIVSVQGSGNYVGGSQVDGAGEILANLKTASYEDIVSFRMALEAQAAALAAQNRTDDHILKLRHLLTAFDTLDTCSLDGVIELRLADLSFHEAIWHAAGNPILTTLLESLVPAFSMYWLRHKKALRQDLQSISETVLCEHNAIADAITAGDPGAAQLAMRSHLRRLQQRVSGREAEIRG